MHRNVKRIIAAFVGGAMLATPAGAWAEKPGQDFCSTYDQVSSNATGGSYVGGILIYETTGSVQRSPGATTTTTTTSTTTTVSINGSGGSATTTVTTANTVPNGPTVTTDEPVGFYRMNDGSTYEINCLTGENRQVS